MYQPAKSAERNPPRLRSYIADSAIAWDVNTIPPDAALYALSSEFLLELDKNRSLINQEIPAEGRDVDNIALPALRHEIAHVRKNFLDRGLGFAVLRGLDPAVYTPVEMENAYWRICNELGTPFVQKAHNIRFGRVEDLGLPAAARPRYHETGTGGSIHTDSPIMPRVADFVGLLCVRVAIQGGQSKFVSVARVHNILLQHAEDLLSELYQPFFFDRRIKTADVSPENPALLVEPIFTYNPALGDRGLKLRWQPEYVWEAPQLDGVPPLTEKQQLALHVLEGILEDRAGAITVCMTMQPGDIQLVNNHVLAHGRTPFFDHRLVGNSATPDPERRRLMRRVWMYRFE
jgi:alpha-ketoglutarate-dependent taurine dioxygenase